MIPWQSTLFSRSDRKSRTGRAGMDHGWINSLLIFVTALFSAWQKWRNDKRATERDKQRKQEEDNRAHQLAELQEEYRKLLESKIDAVHKDLMTNTEITAQAAVVNAQVISEVKQIKEEWEILSATEAQDILSGKLALSGSIGFQERARNQQTDRKIEHLAEVSRDTNTRVRAVEQETAEILQEIQQHE